MRKQATATVGKNTRVASATIKPAKPQAVPFETDPVNLKDERDLVRSSAKVQRNQDYKSVPEQIAESKFYYKNWLWDLKKEYFPYIPKLRHVDYYFPDAVGGPLLVDCAQKTVNSTELIEKKTPAMKKAGFRYIVLDYGMGIDEAAARLAKIDAELGNKK